MSPFLWQISHCETPIYYTIKIVTLASQITAKVFVFFTNDPTITWCLPNSNYFVLKIFIIAKKNSEGNILLKDFNFHLLKKNRQKCNDLKFM